MKKGALLSGYGIVQTAVLKMDFNFRSKIVYCYLASMTGSSEWCWPKIETIRDDLKIAKKAVTDAIHELEKLGLLEVAKINKSGWVKNKKYRILHLLQVESGTIESSTVEPSEVPQVEPPESSTVEPSNNKNNLSQTKDKTKHAAAIAAAKVDLKDLYHPFWMESKGLELIPLDKKESKKMFYSMLSVLMKHKREHIADGLKFAMRWLRYCLRKKRVPPGWDDRRKWVIGEIKHSLDYIRDRGLQATEDLAKFAINEDFWSGALFSLKNLYKAESKREAMLENDK